MLARLVGDALVAGIGFAVASGFDWIYFPGESLVFRAEWFSGGFALLCTWDLVIYLVSRRRARRAADLDRRVREVFD